MDTFEERFGKLNAEQQLAVQTIEGPVMVIAGPGTGKTEILTMRIANILKKAEAKKSVIGAGRTRPENILAITFTESGAITMRRRLADLIGQEAYRVSIHTFHGFANSIIREYPDYFPGIVGAASITEIDQVRIVKNLLDREHLKELRPFGDRYFYLKKIMSAIDELKKQGVSPESFDAIIEKERFAFDKIDDLIWDKGAHKGKMKGKYADQLKHINRNAELGTVYAAYQAALKKAKQYDYSDMIMEVSLALETHNELLQILQDRFHYFLIDEHQDTNKAQNRIIELLASNEGAIPAKAGTQSKGPNLFVVGDEKQAIYRFQGASLENFLYFQSKFPDVVLIPLTSNYRSTQVVLDAADAISSREAKLSAKAGHPEAPIQLAGLSSPDVEYHFIAQKIKNWLKNGVKPEEIAVLYRDNRDVVPLVRILEKEGVSFNIESDEDILGDDEMRKLLRILRAVQNFGNDAALVEALHVDFLGIEPFDVYRLSVFAHRAHMSICDFLHAGKAETMDDFKKGDASIKFGKLFENFSNWKRASENWGAIDAFEKIVCDSGFLAHVLKHPSATEKVMKLHAFFDLLKSLVERDRNYTLKDFFAYLDLMIEHDISLKASGTIHLPGRIRLMTAHRSKGLEFERVVIMNAVAGKWGFRTRREHIKLPKGIYRTTISDNKPVASGEDEDPEELVDDADERNVFYVALTRAKREVLVTYSHVNREGKEQLLTPFVADLPQDIFLQVETDDVEDTFRAHPEIEFAPALEKLPELEDREFLKGLFEEQGISVTALNNYLECPWQYFYRNLVRIPEAPNKHLAFGSAVHIALKDYFECLTEGNDRGKDFFIRRFEEALAIQPVSASDYEETLEKGKVALGGWYDEYHGTWNPKTITELRVQGVMIDDVPVNGMVDKLELKDSKNLVDVIDYKTGAPKSRNAIEGKVASSNGNYKRQLVFYKLLLDTQGEYDMQSGTIDFIEPDEKGKYHRETFEVSEAERVELIKTIKTVTEEIRSFAFWNRTCGREDCAYCALREQISS
jgi:DNA helicase-2/ATP-dependent DNA helicase PcrA